MANSNSRMWVLALLLGLMLMAITDSVDGRIAPSGRLISQNLHDIESFVKSPGAIPTTDSSISQKIDEVIMLRLNGNSRHLLKTATPPDNLQAPLDPAIGTTPPPY